VGVAEMRRKINVDVFVHPDKYSSCLPIEKKS
jgi:hypothetical protein